MCDLSPELHTFLKTSLFSEYKISKLKGDAGERRYYRISGKKTYLLMLQTPFSIHKDSFLNIQTYLESRHIPCPRVICFDGHLGSILLEDLGDMTLQNYYLQEGEKKSQLFYEKALDHLITLQFASKLDENCFAFKSHFHQGLFLKELNFSFFHLNKLFGLSFQDSDCLDFFKDISTQLDRKRAFCHKDYHSRNLMIFKNDTYSIDFQDALLGPVFYDVVSLIHDGYVPLSDSFKEHLLAYYMKQVKDYYPGVEEDFEESFSYQLLQRTFKACGSFASFKHLKNDSNYLKYIPQNFKLLLSVMKKDFKHQTLFLNFLEKGLEKGASL